MAWSESKEPRIEVDRNAAFAAWDVWIRAFDIGGEERIVTVHIPDRGEWRLQGPWITTEGTSYQP